MKKNKVHIVLLLVGLLFGNTNAQQLPLYSQYMTNQYVINPAYTGTLDYFVAASNYRYQWVGITDAPRTYILSVHGPHKYKSYGIGGAIYNDVTGPTSRTGLYLSYAYHLKINREQKVSLGLSGGILQYRVDGTKVSLLDPGDLALTNSLLTAIMPDFGFGAYWYSKKFYLGMSIPQFIHTRINLYDNETQSLSKLKSHIFVNGGYKFEIDDDWAIEPSALIKYSYPVVPQFDIGLRGFFRDAIWLGAVYRTQDAFSALVGYQTPDGRFSFGYSYDITQSNLANYSNGTHEFSVVARFKKIKSKRSRSRSRKKKMSKLEKLQQRLKELEEEEKKLDGGNDNKEPEKKKDGGMKHYKPGDKKTGGGEVKKEKKEEKKTLERQMIDLEQKDRELRAKIRSLRQEAKSQGYEGPNDPNFPKRAEYLKTLDEIKAIYKKKKEIDAKL